MFTNVVQHSLPNIWNMFINSVCLISFYFKWTEIRDIYIQKIILALFRVEGVMMGVSQVIFHVHVYKCLYVCVCGGGVMNQQTVVLTKFSPQNWFT